MFIEHLDQGKDLPNKIDLYLAQNIVLITESLKMRKIQKKFLLEIIMPMLNRDNIIFFIKLAYNKLSMQKQDEQESLKEELDSPTSLQDEEEFWFEFFSYSLDLAAAHVHYLLKKRSSELKDLLEPSIVEEIIERAIRFYRADLQYDNSLLFESLMKIRGCDSIFQLLEQERLKIIDNETQIINQEGGVRPTLTWKIQNLSGNFYRESDPFMVEQAQWKLSISYFKAEEEALNVSIKMVNNPFEVKKSKDYFKKKDFFLPSNIGMQNQINPIEELENDGDMTEDQIQLRRKQMEQAQQEYPSHSFITIVSAVKIRTSDQLSSPLVHTLICSAKSPALLKKFSPFSLYTLDPANQITVEIYFKIKYIYSAILLYISRNFTYLINDQYISLIPKDQLKLILKHKWLNVTQEDEVVKAICLWSENRHLTDNPDVSGLDQEVSELLENINWNYVTLPCLLDLCRNFARIRRNQTFQKILHKEFQSRLKFNAETSTLDAPRFCYKYNKSQQYGTGGNIAKGKNQKALLYINHENFLQSLVESILEPVDLIKSHLGGDGASESSHRKFLEMQLELKRREMLSIEEQLKNMRLLDELGTESKPNSRLYAINGRNSHASNPNNRSANDEVETVKNSMINLLNVIDNGQKKIIADSSNNHFIKSSHLRQKSQEVMNLIQNRQSKNEDSVVYDIYENLNQISHNNKLKIITKKETEEDEERISVTPMNMGNMLGDIESDKDQQEDDDDENEEEEKISRYDYQQQTTYKNIKEQGIDVGVGGSFNHFTNDVQVKNESREIQTSLQVLIRQSQSIKMIHRDQSIQMSIQGSEKVSETQRKSIFEKFIEKQVQSFEEGSSISNDIERAEEINRQIDQNLKDINDSCKSLQTSNKVEEEKVENQSGVSKNQSDQQPKSIDYQSKPPNFATISQPGSTTNKKAIQQQQEKLKYQQQMMEYTQFVQKMSKDIFDHSFLERFMQSPTQEQHALLGMVHGGSFQANNNSSFQNQMQQNKAFNTTGNSGKQTALNINVSQGTNNINSTMALTPISRLNISTNQGSVVNHPQQSLNSTQINPLKGIKSPTNNAAIVLAQTNPYQPQQFLNINAQQQMALKKDEESQRAKSQSLQATNERGQKIYQKRVKNQSAIKRNPQGGFEQSIQKSQGFGNSTRNNVKTSNYMTTVQPSKQQNAHQYNAMMNQNSASQNRVTNTIQQSRFNNKVVLQNLLNETLAGENDQSTNAIAWTNQTEQKNAVRPLSNEALMINTSKIPLEMTAQIANFNILDQIKQASQLISPSNIVGNSGTQVFLDMQRLHFQNTGRVEESKRCQAFQESDRYNIAAFMPPTQSQQRKLSNKNSNPQQRQMNQDIQQSVHYVQNRGVELITQSNLNSNKNHI